MTHLIAVSVYLLTQVYENFRTWGAVTFLPEKFTQFPNARLLKSGYKRTQIARIRKTTSFTIYPSGGKIFVEVQFRGFWIFQVSREQNCEFGFQTRRNNFSRIFCTLFESNKNGSHMVVFVTLFATNFIEVRRCKTKS